MDEKRLQPDEWLRNELKEAGAIWTYSGLPNRAKPHVCLTSGQHSDGFADVRGFLKENRFKRMQFARIMVDVLRESWGGACTRVAGSDTSATDLASNIADILGVEHIRLVKTETGGEKRQVWHHDNLPLQDGELILNIEELLTTSLSALLVREGIREANPEVAAQFVPVLLVGVDRSNPEGRIVRVEKSEVISILRLEIKNYLPAECPYCKAGSEAIKPKEGDNWLRLTNS